jgi:hypothetical protein
MSDVTMTVRIAEELQREAQAAAELRGESLSDVVSSALESYVKKTKQSGYDPVDALKNDPLLSLRFTGGPGDVSDRVEEILRDASDPITGFSLDDDRSR